MDVAGERQLSSELNNEPKALLEPEAKGGTARSSCDEQSQVSEDMWAFKTRCWRWL